MEDNAPFPTHISMESVLGFWSQLARTGRQFVQLTPACRAEESGWAHLDQLLFFFLSFYSLRDWLRECAPAALAKWNGRFNGQFEWRVCRDTATRFKHLKITSPSLKHPLTLAREYCPPNQLRVMVIGPDEPMPLYDVAARLWSELNGFVREADQAGLLPPRERDY